MFLTQSECNELALKKKMEKRKSLTNLKTTFNTSLSSKRVCKFSAAIFLDLCSEIINSLPLSCPLSWRSHTNVLAVHFHQRQLTAHRSSRAKYFDSILVAEQFCPFYLAVLCWQKKTLSFPNVKYTGQTSNWLPASCQQTLNNERMFCALVLTQPSKMCLFCVFV